MTSAAPDPARLLVRVRGHVQGVGFRWWTRYRAGQLSLAGSAVNLPDGRVEIDVEGARSDCEALLADLRPGVAPGRVADVDVTWAHPRGVGGFTVG